MNTNGFKFAVEYGLMSMTASKETAFAYSGKNQQRCTVFEISAGRIDVGASLRVFSQYPEEDEYLMPPLACYEVNACVIAHRDVSLKSCILLKYLIFFKDTASNFL